jgi:hypothetical protein
VQLNLPPNAGIGHRHGNGRKTFFWHQYNQVDIKGLLAPWKKDKDGATSVVFFFEQTTVHNDAEPIRTLFQFNSFF